MGTKLLDTTFLVHHWSGRSAVKSYLEAQPERTEYVTTTLNLKELAVGRKLTNEFDAAEIRSQFRWVRIVPISTGIAWAAADVEAPLHRDDAVNRDRINALAGDVLIAGAAADLDATVVSNNADDFRELGVPVESY
jgi:predicted nucleic acid-binding protein